MSKRSTFAKGALAIAAGVMALSAAASPVSAQPASSAPTYSSGYSGGGNYDPCQREANNRGVGGALIGGGLGAVAGSQVAASGHRTDGSVVGALVGAIAGGVIGHNTAACGSAPPPPSGQVVYNDVPPPPPPPVVYDSYPRHRAYREVSGPPVGPDGCTFADSVVYMPDGGTEHRSVRVCLDHYGRFHIAD